MLLLSTVRRVREGSIRKDHVLYLNLKRTEILIELLDENLRSFLRTKLRHHSSPSMCRFVIYKGTSPVQLSHVITRFISRHSMRLNFGL